jgi:hypothetical protein
VALWIATLSALASAVDYSRRINAIMATRPAPESMTEPEPSSGAAPKEARNRLSA